MTAKQLSVFIENRKGRLEEVLTVLKENNVNIISLSLADTTEYGLLRLIVNDAEKGKEMLAKDGFSTLVSEVLIVKIAHKAGSLQEMLKILSKYDVNVEYMYGLSVDGQNAYVVLKTSDMEKIKQAVKECNIQTLTTEEISAL
ncbi:MAG TPA: amino acid-binding protein [Clostridiales bacterium]|nr:amino acid-binding protein [Clostridiales bacterium]